MIIYRTGYRTEEGLSAGYTFHASKREAKQAWHEAEQSGANRMEMAEPIEVRVPLNRTVLLCLLNTFAGHASNG